MDHDTPSRTDLPADIAEALERVRTRFPGERLPPVFFFASVASTNDLAMRLAESGADDGTTVVAELQTAGRGRLGRTWFSPPGAGLYVSVLVRPYPVQFPSGIVTLAAGVGFGEALRACTHLPIEIKWPNDLVVGRRKLAGILTEAAGAGKIQHLVVGVGINVRSAAYPPDIADRATSLEAELGRPMERGYVLAECLASLAERVADLRAARVEAVLDRWRSLAPSAIGSRVEWTTPTGVQTGMTAGLDADGALLVATKTGIERVFAGEVRWT